MDQIYMGDVTVASSSANACGSVMDASTVPTTVPGDVLFADVNQWICQYNNLSGQITNWEAVLDTGFANANTDLDAAKLQVGAASDQAQKDINDASTQLQTSLDQQAAQAVGDAQTAVQDSRDTLTQEQKNASALLATQMAAVLASLNSQVDMSVKDTETTRQALQADFKALLVDLGDPSSEHPTGMIGKLRSTSQVTAKATDQLRSLASIIQGSIDTQSLAVQALALQSRQLDVGQQILASTPYLCGQPKPVGARTIYTYHIGES